MAPKTADWEPGTLDKTRKAIGKIDPNEASSMAKKLGGEVMRERSTTRSSASAIQNKTVARKNATMQTKVTPQTYSQNSVAFKRRKKNDLQHLNAKVLAKMDALMMSSAFQIKPNYGILNFIRKFQKNGTERIIQSFYDITVKLYIDNMESFITVVKTLIQIAPNTYKAKIANGTDAKFKFLRMVAGWQILPIRLAYSELKELPPPLLTVDFIPLIKEIYKPLMMVYYYGAPKIPKLIKEIYADQVAYPNSDAEKLSSLAKEAITDWLYIETEIIKKLYPLLMRMSSDTFEYYPEFFSKKIAAILKFLGLHKFDLLLPEKPKEETVVETKVEKPEDSRGKKDETVQTGFMMLDRLFPEAGFLHLENFPDLYPYFQPLYKFDDGANMISPNNPMQILLILLRIIEDFFHACRNIQFVETENANDSLAKLIEDWPAYRENIFSKLCMEPLRDFVNQVYSQNSFEETKIGRKLLMQTLSQTQYYFFPQLQFENMLINGSPENGKYEPLYLRTDFARKELSRILQECDSASQVRAKVSSIKNPWEHYEFDMPNEISKRLDVLLGGNNKTPQTNAHNVNLLKYTLCILSVLDWFTNNTKSPAYANELSEVYRVSAEDGKPLFSVEERHDQNKLFADSIRKAFKK